MLLNSTYSLDSMVGQPNYLLQIAMFLPQCFYLIILLLGVYGMYQGIEIQEKNYIQEHS